MIDEFQRHDREKRIIYWNDKKIHSSKTAIVGLTRLGIHTLIDNAALGRGADPNGEILIFDSRECTDDMLLDIPLKGRTLAQAVAEAVKKINPNAKITPFSTDMRNWRTTSLLDDVSCIVDATQDPVSKAVCLEKAARSEIPLISGFCNANFLKISMYHPKKHNNSLHQIMPDYDFSLEDEALALSGGALITDQLKWLSLHDYKLGKHCLDEELYVLGGLKTRFSWPTGKLPKLDNKIFKNKKVLVVGFGALGNPVCYLLAHYGVDFIGVVDFDIFDSTNLSRQILAYDSVGQNKAEVAARKIPIISREKTKSKAYPIPITLDFDLEGIKYDVIFDLVDNKYTRAIIAGLSVKHKIPLISTASDPEGVRTSVYSPGRTDCMNHVFNVYAKGIEEERIRRVSCPAQPDGSIIMTNHFGAGISVAELRALWQPEFGPLINGYQEYSSVSKPRLYTVDRDNKPCSCHKKPLPKEFVEFITGVKNA